MVLIRFAERLPGDHLFDRKHPCFQAGNGALPDQITFEFAKRCKDMTDQLSGW